MKDDGILIELGQTWSDFSMALEPDERSEAKLRR
jgi:hypothetical protein